MKRLVLATCAAVLLATPVLAQVDFSRYVALGDSLTAGFASGGLTEYYQTRSYPAVLAAQAGAADFQIPTVTAPGFPPLMALVSLDPLVIAAPDAAPGLPTNAELARPYNNLGVPQFTVFNMMFTPGDINNLLAGNLDNPFADLILRIPQVPDPATGELMDFTAITQAIALNPTFLTMWIGNNDILTAAVYGTPIEGVTMTPVETFQQLYGMAAGALATYTSADMVFMTLPDMNSIAFVNAVDPYVDVPGVGRVPVLSTDPETGEVIPLTDDYRLTLYASAFLQQGIGLPQPIGTGQPLPDDLTLLPDGTLIPGVVLRPDEAETISDRIRAYNSIIRANADAVGAAVLDINSLLAELAAGDYGAFGGIELTTDFLVGGIFSYDGVHPQNIGYAVVALELIKVINEAFGADIPLVNMDQVLCAGGCADQGPPGMAPTKEFTLAPGALDGLMEAFPLLKTPPRAATGVARSSSTQ